MTEADMRFIVFGDLKTAFPVCESAKGFRHWTKCKTAQSGFIKLQSLDFYLKKALKRYEDTFLVRKCQMILLWTLEMLE